MATDLTQVMGIGGYVGEIREGPDGQLYEWVEGVDGLGSPVGFWRGLKRFAQRARQRLKKVISPFARFALPYTKFIPGYGPAIYAAGSAAQRAGILGTGHIAEGPNGQLYEYVESMDGLGNPVGFWRQLRQAAGSLVSRIPGVGRIRGIARPFCQALPQLQTCVQQIPATRQALDVGQRVCSALRTAGLAGTGDIAQGADGQLYEWVEGVDGLGNPIGFWRQIRRAARGLVQRARGALPGVVRGLVQRVPGLQQVTGHARQFCSLLPQLEPCVQRVPAAQPAYRLATRVCGGLRQVGLAGGGLMEAPDGQLYEVVEGIGAFGERRRMLRRVRLIIPAYISAARRRAAAAAGAPTVRPR
jgi:hypothetical protein